MKHKILNILNLACVLLGIGLVMNCSNKYEYDADYSIYKGLTLIIEDADNEGLVSIDKGAEHKLAMSYSDTSIFLDNRSFLYTLSDTTILDIDAEGNIKPKRRGFTNLDVKFRGNIKLETSCKIQITEVIIPVEEIVLPENFGDVEVQEGKKLDLTKLGIYVLPANASYKTFTYTSLDESIATVDKNTGLVTALAEGTARILLTSMDDTDFTKEINFAVVGEVLTTSMNFKKGEYANISIAVGDYIPADTTIINILPISVSSHELKYEILEGNTVVKISEKGLVEGVSAGIAKIKITTTDGTNISLETTITVTPKDGIYFNRYFWTIKASRIDEDNNPLLGGAPELMLDGNSKSYSMMHKKGKGNNAVNGGNDNFFIVDMKAEYEFNSLLWAHRSDNSYNYLRLWGADILGSNDGVNFTLIDKVNIPYDSNTSPFYIKLPNVKYRFVKVLYTKWSDNSGGATSGNGLQVAEFNLGKD